MSPDSAPRLQTEGHERAPARAGDAALTGRGARSGEQKAHAGCHGAALVGNQGSSSRTFNRGL